MVGGGVVMECGGGCVGECVDWDGEVGCEGCGLVCVGVGV